MREIVLDTETTGLDPAKGHRIVEIGCVELFNCIPTGSVYHVYLNPERDMPEEAFKVHGLSQAFLSDKPRFADVAARFAAFLGEAQLVAHNAEFDFRFINAELAGFELPLVGTDRVVDTLALARRRHPGQTNSLDALCARYGIDNSRRTKHGALLDAEILAEVYAELCGGRQTTLGLSAGSSGTRADDGQLLRRRPAALPPRLTEAEIATHAAFVATLSGKPLWSQYLDVEK